MPDQPAHTNAYRPAAIRYMPPANCAEFARFVGDDDLADDCADYPASDADHMRETWMVRTAAGYEEVRRGQWVVQGQGGFLVLDAPPAPSCITPKEASDGN